ncbi:MAG: hypothetical protein JO015_09125 [Verrucomicrobia bacterium]|nr:hypothetical protein [Verrucomicrobiota bacterium]
MDSHYIKWRSIGLTIAAFFCLAAREPQSTQAEPGRIIAGEGIGQIRLGRFGAASLARLPRPDADDSGMGRYRSVWLSGKPGGRTDTLCVYSVANGPRDIQPLRGVSIKLIRVTSSRYRTPDGLSTGSRFDQMMRHFPGARPRNGDQSLYDDTGRGIAFEFDGPATAGSRCIAIMVHLPGDEDVHLATAREIDELLRSNGKLP